MEGWRSAALGGAKEEPRKTKNPERTPLSFRAEWWQIGPRRQGSADAAKNAPLTAPGGSEHLGRVSLCIPRSRGAGGRRVWVCLGMLEEGLRSF